jgi:hypothetical protein
MVGLGETFLKYVCKVVDNLSAAGGGAQYVGPLAGDLIKVFLEVCLEGGRSIASVNYCLNVIINLIKCSGSVPICNLYIDFVMGNYPNLHSLERERRDIFYSGFFTIAQVIGL